MQRISTPLSIASLAGASMLKVKVTDEPLIEGCECLTSYGGVLDDNFITVEEAIAENVYEAAIEYA